MTQSNDKPLLAASYSAEAVKQRGGKGWFVTWFQKDGPGYGSRGANMSEDVARRLASEIIDGQVTP